MVIVFWKVVLLGFVGIQQVWVLDVRCGVRQCFFIKMVDQVKVLCLLRLWGVCLINAMLWLGGLRLMNMRSWVRSPSCFVPWDCVLDHRVDFWACFV